MKLPWNDYDNKVGSRLLNAIRRSGNGTGGSGGRHKAALARLHSGGITQSGAARLHCRGPGVVSGPYRARFLRRFLNCGGVEGHAWRTRRGMRRLASIAGIKPGPQFKSRQLQGENVPHSEG